MALSDNILQKLFFYIQENYKAKINIYIMYYPEMIRIGHNYACIYDSNSKNGIIFHDLDNGSRIPIHLEDPNSLDKLIDLIKQYDDPKRKCKSPCNCNP